MIRLLIVEDRFLVADAMRAALTAQGFDVIGMTGIPDRALEIAESEHPDLALVDVSLSESPQLRDDGVELAGRLRRRHGVPSLFVTGARHLLHGDEGIGCVNKPCSEAQLGGAIEAAMALLARDVMPEVLPEGVQLWRGRTSGQARRRSCIVHGLADAYVGVALGVVFHRRFEVVSMARDIAVSNCSGVTWHRNR